MTRSTELVAACEVLVLRALERAGNKRRSRLDAAKLQHVPDQETHLHLTVDADDCGKLLNSVTGRGSAFGLVEPIAVEYGVDPERLRTALADFVCELLTMSRGWTDVERVKLAEHLARRLHLVLS